MSIHKLFMTWESYVKHNEQERFKKYKKRKLSEEEIFDLETIARRKEIEEFRAFWKKRDYEATLCPCCKRPQ